MDRIDEARGLSVPPIVEIEQWQEGDVAFWDNRATEHYAIADYGNLPRHVQRVTIAGDIPVSIDGKHGQTIKGDSSAYHLS